MPSIREALGLITSAGITGYDGVRPPHRTREAEADLETWLILTKVMNLRLAWDPLSPRCEEGRGTRQATRL